MKAARAIPTLEKIAKGIEAGAGSTSIPGACGGGSGQAGSL
jgi:hypothetical protein